MRLLPSFFLLLFLVLFGACQPKSEANRGDDFVKIEGLIDKIESNIQGIRVDLERIADYNEVLLQNREAILAAPGPFKYTMDGPFSANQVGENAFMSTIVMLNSSTDKEKALELIQLTNSMDSLFADFMQKNPNAVQIYSNAALGSSRIYPTFDAKNIVDANVDVTKFNFFYEADLAHNPSKGTVWIPEPYVDPAGKGWIFSLVHPVYEGDALSSVLGVDLTIADAIDTYLDEVDGYFVLVSGNGDIIGGKSDAIELLGMPLLKNHVYRETIQMDNFRGADFNLSRSKNAEVRQMAQAILVEKKNSFDFEQDTRMARVLGKSFASIDWYLLEIQLPD
jgi:hypothetical protein